MTRLIVAVMLLAACVPTATSSQASPAAPASPSASLAPGTCEYIGARFTLAPGFTAKQSFEPNEPLARITVDGDLPGRHHVLLDIVPRAIASYRGGSSLTAVSTDYFARLRSGVGAKWTDVRETQYRGPQRTYPGLTAVEPFSTAGIPGQYDHTILLLVPDPLPGYGYFYSFFWTDIHLAADPRAAVTELEKLVDGVVLLGSPVGATARGCA